MKMSFYPKLAWTGIEKNKRLYKPYIFTCIGMLMMYYIMGFLTDSSVLVQLKGGDIIQQVLRLGSGVIAVFAMIFLFYTNSFLVRRRKKEFGLYNILGMGKQNIARILIWETLIIFAITFLAGSFAGIVLSKLAELALINIMNGEVTYSFTISVVAIKNALLWFAMIFFLILLNTLRQIHTSNPVTLLRSENSGEKPPKANWVLGIAGAILLGFAYYIAVSIEEPVSALMWFFVAVIMVIIATYLLFIAGSVVFCRMLQKKKNYYYKSEHFVSVSSMVYRMKRNGAGLASICILITMVLVMIASTTCLYIGGEESLRVRYPRNIEVDIGVQFLEELQTENIDRFREKVLENTEEYQQEQRNVLEYVTASFAGYLENGFIEMDITKLTDFSMDTYDRVVQAYFISLDDYNRITGMEEQLGEDEALVYSYGMSYNEERIAVNGGRVYQVKKVVDEFIGTGNAAMSILPSIYIVVPDLDAAAEPLLDLYDYNGNRMVQLHWYYGFDMDAEYEEQILLFDQIYENCRNLSIESETGLSYSCGAVARERDEFFAMYGGLFFLGIMLSVVFVFAAVLIIYYKQISEGYEDQSRFEIMQKVGMTKKEIRKCINSQMLTVFYLPLVAAGIHLAFAFPIIEKLLQLFCLMNTTLLIITTIVCVLVFALFYMLVYRMTSNAYYTIVSGVKEEVA